MFEGKSATSWRGDNELRGGKYLFEKGHVYREPWKERAKKKLGTCKIELGKIKQKNQRRRRPKGGVRV